MCKYYVGCSFTLCGSVEMTFAFNHGLSCLQVWHQCWPVRLCLPPACPASCQLHEQFHAFIYMAVTCESAVDLVHCWTSHISCPRSVLFSFTPMVHIPRRYPRMQYLIQWSVHLERRSVSLLNEVWESSDRRGDRCSLLSLQLTGAPVMWDPLCEGMQTLFCRNERPASVLERWWWWSLLMVLLTIIYVFKTTNCLMAKD